MANVKSRASTIARNLYAKGRSKEEILAHLADQKILTRNGKVIDHSHLNFYLQDVKKNKHTPRRAYTKRQTPTMVTLDAAPVSAKVTLLICDVSDLRNILRELL